MSNKERERHTKVDNANLPCRVKKKKSRATGEEPWCGNLPVNNKKAVVEFKNNKCTRDNNSLPVVGEARQSLSKSQRKSSTGGSKDTLDDDDAARKHPDDENARAWRTNTSRGARHRGTIFWDDKDDHVN